MRLPPGVPIRVDATVAEVTITGSARADVGVDIVRRAPSDAGLAAYPARIDEGPDLLRISAVQPGEGRDETKRERCEERLFLEESVDDHGQEREGADRVGAGEGQPVREP